MKNYLNRIGINAVKAGLKIINKEKKNKILKDYVSLLTKYNDKILKENLKDLRIARQKKLDINLIIKYSVCIPSRYLCIIRVHLISSFSGFQNRI